MSVVGKDANAIPDAITKKITPANNLLISLNLL
jgi:hypothetical protein